MKTLVLLVLWEISATYANEKKITESGVSRKSRGIGVGSHAIPHLHAHGEGVPFAAHPDVEPLPILGSGPAAAPIFGHGIAPAVGVAPAVAPHDFGPGPAVAPIIGTGIAPAVGVAPAITAAVPHHFGSGIPHAVVPSAHSVLPSALANTFPASPAIGGAILSGDGGIGENGVIPGANAAFIGASEAAVVGSTHIDLGRIVQHHVHVINRVGVPVEQRFPVEVERKIPISVPHPVDVPVDRPYPVHVPVKVPVKIVNNVPVPVEKPVPVPVKVHVRVPIQVPFKVFHPQPVAVPVEQRIPIPVPDPVIVRRPIPVAIHTHLEPLHLHNLHHHHHH